MSVEEKAHKYRYLLLYTGWMTSHLHLPLTTKLFTIGHISIRFMAMYISDLHTFVQIKYSMDISKFYPKEMGWGQPPKVGGKAQLSWT